MEEKEIIKTLKLKLQEAEQLQTLDSKNPKFRSWHISTMALLKSLPLKSQTEVNKFKRLSFQDTKYHRGSKFSGISDNSKFREDLKAAVEILSGIMSARKGRDIKDTVLKNEVTVKNEEETE